MEMLCKLDSATHSMNAAKIEYDQLDGRLRNEGLQRQEAQRIRTRYNTSRDRWIAIEERIVEMEIDLSITTRWTPGSPEYDDALRLMDERQFCQALDNLERLVVQRLFELTKLGASGLGK